MVTSTPPYDGTNVHHETRCEGQEGTSEVVETRVTTVTKWEIVEKVVTTISTPLPTPTPDHCTMPESSEMPPPEGETGQVIEKQNKTPRPTKKYSDRSYGNLGLKG